MTTEQQSAGAVSSGLAILTDYEVTLKNDKDPPEFAPKSTTCHLGDTILFSTADGSTLLITINGPSGGTDINISVRTPWVPSAIYNYGLVYNHKGGTTTGNVNVIVTE